MARQSLDPTIQRQLTQEGFGALPTAFDPTQFRQQVETARGEIAAPSLRALEQRVRKGQLAGRFTNPAVQAAMQAQEFEGFGAGRGQILAGAGQAALGRELPIQRLQQQERQQQLGRIQELGQQRELAGQQRAATRLQDLQFDLLRQRRLEGTMGEIRERFRMQSERERGREATALASRRAAAEKQAEAGGLSQTASNIIRAFGPSAGRR